MENALEKRPAIDIAERLERLTVLAAKELYWTQHPCKSTLQAAFESVLRRGQMRLVMHHIEQAAHLPFRPGPADRLRAIAHWALRQDDEKQAACGAYLDSFLPEFDRVEDRAAREGAGFIARIGICRRREMPAERYEDIKGILKHTF